MALISDFVFITLVFAELIFVIGIAGTTSCCEGRTESIGGNAQLARYGIHVLRCTGCS